MKFLIVIALFISTLFGAELEWTNDYEKALSQATKEKKQIYILITSSSCGWCRKFENTTLQNKAVLKRLKQKFVLVHVDRDMDELPEMFKIDRVPRHYFVTQKGEIIHTFMGYWSSEDFNSLLDDVDKKIKK
ncbi:MAG: thioredoxin family protein [Sulfurimonas sp.]|nr:thioredoxin family protein [Sulfurimonas sp.]